MDEKTGSSKNTKSKAKFYNDIGFDDNFTIPPISASFPTEPVIEKNSFNRFSTVHPSPMVCYVLRLRRGDELRKSLIAFAEEKNLKAAFVITCVGSAKSAKLRLANTAQNVESHYMLDVSNPTEIVSLVGTISGGGHMHITLSDMAGKTNGGHLLELIVDTTAEIVVGECTSLSFTRVLDKDTEYKELQVNVR
ncbi:bifunctional protein GlmU isoform X1 [Hydra vulgaris]|uniref:bifunctional protein GlmU isoform X1 n=1 Tax=Hydra vulgaris TaxID=6087 RepID=UPI001F5E8CB0|nr:bifunctional protein GlmU isoform X2 [Hydra vulgaris]